ncbi:class I SAM-dependent methyltransferase [Seonamhaeicola sediminis]|uniref:Class I SAM-dependent methyltransferase n=1 Tax=Seonamhaeicola sediminis TaxID=2528206 RepID=A0A562YI65_9FLAO|nr:class I SAM-dependent methyltransferase [Seonamhaeicola sediminis]TWO34397.1 class I SAM-dependent methyltransferase [Seonamhaeicola sediminis]
MLFQLIQYIKFLLKSTNQHGVHSPFVYDLITKCFYDKTSYTEYNAIKVYRSKLLQNRNTIQVNDLGLGSRKTKTNIRLVNEIAKTSGTTLKRSKLLFRISKYFKPDQVLELGTSLGIATHALATGNPKANITTIEGCPEIASFSKKQLHQYKNIELKIGDFKDLLPKLTNKSYNLIFFDGNHKKEATLQYFEALLPTINNNTVFIFDDIYWSKGMTEAWETIKLHPKVTVTIDTFFWGFVFFRKEQVKEHFSIRVNH